MDLAEIANLCQVPFAQAKPTLFRGAVANPEEFFGVQNSRKAYKGMLASLLDPRIMAAKRKDEARLKEAAQKDDKLAGAVKEADG